MSPQTKGRELKNLQEFLGLRSEEICAEAKVSMSSLRGVMNDSPTVRSRTRKSILEAFDRLKSRIKATG